MCKLSMVERVLESARTLDARTRPPREVRACNNVIGVSRYVACPCLPLWDNFMARNAIRFRVPCLGKGLAGWFKWLSWFGRPKIRRSLDIQFSSETGPEKGSWKGGTDDLAEAWADVKREGWRTRKIADEWLHGCPKCKEPT